MPPRAVQETPPPQPHDATKLSIPVLVVASLVMTALSGAGAYYGTTWGLRSDIRSIGEKQDQLTTAVREIKEDVREVQKQLPNKEALDVRLRGMEKDIERLETAIGVAEARWDNANTRLSKNGM